MSSIKMFRINLIAFAALTWSATFCAARITYPAYHVVQRKADPFVALTHTLRQQDLEQQQLQQQQRQQLGIGNVNPNAYYVDYNNGPRSGAASAQLDQPTQDDIYRFEQLQRELGRAAFMPFYGRAQRTAWGQVIPDEVAGQEDDLRNDFVDEDDNGYGYGIPVGGVVLDERRPQRPQQLFQQQNGRIVEDEALDGDVGVWYDGAVAPDDYDRDYDDQRRQRELLDQQDRENQEAQLLLDTLTEYMMMYDNGLIKNQVAPPNEKDESDDEMDEEERELAELEQRKRSSGTRKQLPVVTTTVPALAPTVASSVATVTRHGGVTLAVASNHRQVHAATTKAPQESESRPDAMPMDRQPPVQHSVNGDSLGQKEFPMMRPASAQRPKWLDTYKLQQGYQSAAQASSENSKRHHHSSKTKASSSIVASEDELIKELDNLKTKKN